MAEQIRIGMIGCGGIAHGHVQNIAGMREARVAALVDTDPERIKTMKARHPETKDCPEFADYQDMLKSVELDAVQVHTPHTLHFDQIMDSLDKGLHVLTEKPMVCKVVHAKKVIEKSEQTKKVVLVSYQRHYQGPFRYVQQVINSGQLGKVTAVSALQCQDWYRATKGLWRQKMSLSGGGQLNDSGSHLLDIILWTTGLEPAEVSARCDNLDTEVDIVSALTVKFRGGAQGNISVVGHSPTWWEDITIWGTDGALFYRNGTLRHHVGFGKEVHEVSGFPSYGSPDRNFVDAILGKAEVQSPPVCGLRVTQLTEAAWKSSKLGGKPVKVAH